MTKRQKEELQLLCNEEVNSEFQKGCQQEKIIYQIKLYYFNELYQNIKCTLKKY